jgi:hypothetical protein
LLFEKQKLCYFKIVQVCPRKPAFPRIQRLGLRSPVFF